MWDMWHVHVTDADPNATVLSVDGTGAYDDVYRVSMMSKLFEVPGLRALLPFVRASNDDNNDNTPHHKSIHTNTHTTHHTKHILLSSTDTGPLHCKCGTRLAQEYLDNCFLHGANTFARQGMSQGTCTLALGQVRAVCTERANKTMSSSLRTEERDGKRDEQRDGQREKRKKHV